MRVRLIRNATLRLTYAGHELMTDPFFAPRHTRPSLAGISRNPLVDLPCPVEEVLAGVEIVIVSHLHSDHFDPEAHRLLPKSLPIFCQPGDEASIRSKGFQDVTPVLETTAHRGITVTRTPGRHGRGTVLDEMGSVSGFVFQASGEPVLYWAGDTVWCEPVRATIERFRPAVVVTHSSGAVWKGSGPIVMDAAQTIEVCRSVPQGVVVAIHMDSLDHGRVSRADLRAHAEAAGIQAERLRIPHDGEILDLP